MINKCMLDQSHNHPSRVVFCDTHSWLLDNRYVLNGPHVKPQFLGKVAQLLKMSLGLRHRVSQDPAGTLNTRSRTRDSPPRHNRGPTRGNTAYSQAVKQPPVNFAQQTQQYPEMNNCPSLAPPDSTGYMSIRYETLIFTGKGHLTSKNMK